MLGEKIGKGVTPAEMADLLVEQIPDLRNDIYYLLEQYQLQTYSKHKVNDPDARKYSSKIVKKSIEFWWNLKKKRLAKITDRFR
jgi:hypothetical protein